MSNGSRSVLITGTSSGLGASMAVHLAEKGWLVYATMRDPCRREELDLAVKAAGVDAGRVRVVRLDVTDSSSIRAAVGEIAAETGGRLDAVINNAGVNVEACLEDLEFAGVRRAFDTIVLGAMELTQVSLPMLRNSSDPRLIFISSYAAATGVPATTVYCAAKAAIERFAEALLWEVAPDGIKISVLRPGTFRTDIFERNSGRVRPPDSHYRPLYDRIDPVARAMVINRGRDPRRFARKVACILESPRPRFRYLIGVDSYLVSAGSIFPHRLRYLAARALFKPRLRKSK